MKLRGRDVTSKGDGAAKESSASSSSAGKVKAATASTKPAAATSSRTSNTEETTTISKKRKGELEDTETSLKRAKTSICAAAAELMCPLSLELPIEPCTAMDGWVYERKELETLIEDQGDRLRSPITNERMKRHVLPAPHIRNIIQQLIDSGTIEGDLAKTWTERMEMKRRVDAATAKAKDGVVTEMCNLGQWYLNGMNGLDEDRRKAYEWYKKAAALGSEVGKTKVQEIQWQRKVERTRRKAGCGDTNAMNSLACWYESGEKGLAVDEKIAYKWYKESADLRDVEGMAYAGYWLLSGRGVERNRVHGMTLSTAAAVRGSDYACSTLGKSYFEGSNGLPKDFVQAKYWLSIAVSGARCSHRHLHNEDLDAAIAMLQTIEDGEEGWSESSSSSSSSSSQEESS